MKVRRKPLYEACECCSDMLRPSHLVIRDHAARSLVQAVRGTHCVKVRLRADCLRLRQAAVLLSALDRLQLGSKLTQGCVQDIFTSLTGASKPHHVVDEQGVVLGYSHFGMLAAARCLPCFAIDLQHCSPRCHLQPCLTSDRIAARSRTSKTALEHRLLLDCCCAVGGCGGRAGAGLRGAACAGGW